LDAVLTSYHNARAGLTGILALFSLSELGFIVPRCDDMTSN
jgi:hypothetical protein